MSLSATTYLAQGDIPRLPVGSTVETGVDWLTDNLGVVFDGVADGIDWTIESVATFFATPMVAVLAVLIGLLGLALKGWKVGLIALVAAFAVGYGALLLAVPVTIVWIVTFGLLAFALRGWKFALFTVLAFALIDGMGQWDDAMDTLALVLVATLIALVLAVPLGVAAGKSEWLSSAVRPVLDLMQTMPMFVYLIPAITFFGIGLAPGAVATVIFAMPPGVRLAELGIRQVDREVVEAGEAFGASPWKILGRIQLPLATPTIMAGVNQVIMLALSMVVIAGFVGAGGLGSVVTEAISRVDIGSGFEAGLAVVILAVYLDRLTGALTRRSAVARAQRGSNT